MRYDTEVLFVKETDVGYNPVLGDWVPGKKEVTEKMANVTGLGSEKARLIFGDAKKTRNIVRLRNPYISDWDYLVIAGTEFTFEHSSHFSQKAGFIVAEKT